MGNACCMFNKITSEAHLIIEQSLSEVYYIVVRNLFM